MTWLEYIIQAFENLGGIATYSQLYKEIKKIRENNLCNNWKAVIRATIERHSSDSSTFNGKRDIFYSVDGLGKGLWGLRNINYKNSENTIEKLYGRIEEEINTYRIPTEIKRIVRDTQIIKELKAFHDNRCQICSVKLKLGENKYYSEGHHIKPLGSPHNGPDIKENIIILCPNCHVLCDYGSIKLDFNKINKFDKHIIKKEYIDYHNNEIFKL